MASALSCVICHDCNRALRFFHVPSDSDRQQEWSKLLHLEIKSSAIICEKHFVEEHFTRNVELDCWRLNSKALPTLHLTDETIDYKLINENDFDKKDQNDEKPCTKANTKNIGTQTQKLQVATSCIEVLKCLWCDDCFDTPDLNDVLKHFRHQHRYEIVSFLDDDDDEASRCNFDEAADDTLDYQVDAPMEEGLCVAEEANEINENETQDEVDYVADDEGMDSRFESHEIEVYHVKNEAILSLQKDDSEQGNIDELLNIDIEQAECKPLHNMLVDDDASNSTINIQTSDPSLIFFIIELLQSNPNIWFINGFKSKEYEAGLENFCLQFSEKFQFFISKMHLQETLIEIRDWYQTIYEANTFHLLTDPQSEYFRRLEEFLPDKLDGKTCSACGRIFSDHVQFFAHQKFEHALEDENTQTLQCLKAQANDYFYARYPLRQGGFSYECQVCPTKYGRSSKRVFLEHIKKHLDIRDHVCDICGKAFTKFERFQIHRKRHFGLHKSKCGICGKEFTNFSLLTAHRKRYHRPMEGTIEEIEQLQRQRKMYKSEIYYVPITEGNDIIYGCPFCEKTYKHKSGVHQHCKLMHKNQFSIKARRKQKPKGAAEMRSDEEEHSSDTEIDL